MRLAVWLLALLVGCVPIRAPDPIICLEFHRGVAQKERILEGARRWGFVVVEGRSTSSRPRCLDHWWISGTPCKIVIVVLRDRAKTSTPHGGVTQLARGIFWIREDQLNHYRAAVAAHEVGHFLLHNSEHLRDSQGTMSPKAEHAVTAADALLFEDRTGRGLPRPSAASVSSASEDAPAP